MEELFLTMYFRGLVSKKKDFIGKRSLKRLNTTDRQKIVGLIPTDKNLAFRGSHLVVDKNSKLPDPKLGHVIILLEC